MADTALAHREQIEKSKYLRMKTLALSKKMNGPAHIGAIWIELADLTFRLEEAAKVLYDDGGEKTLVRPLKGLTRAVKIVLRLGAGLARILGKNSQNPDWRQ